VRRWFYLWRDNGLWLSLNPEAVGRLRVMLTGIVGH
jgi:hypothetical protein